MGLARILLRAFFFIIYQITEMYEYKHPRPGYTADVVLLSRNANLTLSVLLVRRGGEPFKGAWALPGGFVEEGETSVEAAMRELKEETGIEITDPEDLGLIGIYDAPGRDPRGWNISAAYTASVEGTPSAKGGDDAAEAKWFDVDELPELAFDHEQIVSDVMFLLDEEA